MHAFVISLLFGVASAAPPTLGPYSVNATEYSISVMDSSDPRVWAWFPTNATPGSKFPLIPYLHGVLGGDLDLLGYTELFSQMASYGFIVVGTFSCNTGCEDAHKPSNSRWTACGGLPPLQPLGMGWDAYYGEAYKIVDWARNNSGGTNSDPFFSMIDWSAGVGVVGRGGGVGGGTQWEGRERRRLWVQSAPRPGAWGLLFCITQQKAASLGETLAQI